MSIYSNCNQCEQRSKSIFCVLKSDELELINQAKKCQMYEKGELIFQEAAGATRETATRVLYHFQESKLIELVAKKIKILNFDGLIVESNILD